MCQEHPDDLIAIEEVDNLFSATTRSIASYLAKIQEPGIPVSLSETIRRLSHRFLIKTCLLSVTSQFEEKMKQKIIMMPKKHKSLFDPEAFMFLQLKCLSKKVYGWITDFKPVL